MRQVLLLPPDGSEAAAPPPPVKEEPRRKNEAIMVYIYVRGWVMLIFYKPLLVDFSFKDFQCIYKSVGATESLVRKYDKRGRGRYNIMIITIYINISL